MEQNRIRTGNQFITPYGQDVLLETTTYGSELELGTANGKKALKTYTIHKVVGFGGLTFDVSLGDLVTINNDADVRTLDVNNELNIFATIIRLNKKSGIDVVNTNANLTNKDNKASVDQVRNVIKHSKTTITPKILGSGLDKNTYVRCLDTNIINEPNVLFSYSRKLLNIKLIKYFITEKVEPIKLDILKDDYITDEFIAEYKVEYEKNLKTLEVKPTIIL